MTRRRVARGERGATVVELALVFPLFSAMILALVHFGLVEAGDSSVSNGAREGARLGTFDYLAADVPGSDTRTAIETKVKAQLGSLVTSPTVAVRCQRPMEGGLSPVACNAGIVLDRDLIEVSVTWSSVSPFGGTRTERARMVIIGNPDLTEIVPPSTTTTTPGRGRPAR
jgi:Flp pilus assembly protein TadG